VGTTVKHAEIISKEEESTGLWDKGAMGANSPSSQLNAAFSGNVGEEHRNLKLSQLERWYNPDHSMYTEIAQIFLACAWALLTSSMFRARLCCQRNFGLAKKVVRGTNIPGKMVRQDHFPL